VVDEESIERRVDDGVVARAAVDGWRQIVAGCTEIYVRSISCGIVRGEACHGSGGKGRDRRGKRGEENMRGREIEKEDKKYLVWVRTRILEGFLMGLI
jgi:hypothetical protein